ncbi:hypothetical protein [Bacillus cereus group sp. MYBK34-1]|uniref:hypothetical protein n=1 Tax=Bacillus cereus group sp. MYBK34-1 TaxID=3450631 RepID=UPI003F79F0EF
MIEETKMVFGNTEEIAGRVQKAIDEMERGGTRKVEVEFSSVEVSDEEDEAYKIRHYALLIARSI